MFDIAIVGLGATGICLLKNLQECIVEFNLLSPKICVFDSPEHLAMGKAFGDSNEICKVNTPPSMLSLSSSEPHSFSSWLQEHQQFSEYPNRHYFSKFLLQSYKEILDNKILDITEFRSPIDNIIYDTSEYLILNDNISIRAKKVVLCIGTINSSSFNEFYGYKGFFSSPKNVESIISSKVIVAGTGLTAIDIFRILNKKDNEIHLFSRHGYPPTFLPADNIRSYIPTYLSWKNLISSGSPSLDIFLSLLEKDSTLINNEKIYAKTLLDKNNLLRYLEYLLNRAKSNDLPYQDLLVSTRPYMYKFGVSLDIKEKVEFMHKNSTSWFTWRHPIPYEVGLELYEAVKSKRLYIHKISGLTYDKENHTFVLENSFKEIIKSKYFIDGTGGSNNLYKSTNPLIINLINNKLIEAHPCGGININPLTYQCIVNQKAIKGLYNIGPLNQGVLFSTNALWFNAYCAYQWARAWAISQLTN